MCLVLLDPTVSEMGSVAARVTVGCCIKTVTASLTVGVPVSVAEGVTGGLVAGHMRRHRCTIVFLRFPTKRLYSWKPVWGTKILGTSIGRGFRALKGFKESLKISPKN